MQNTILNGDLIDDDASEKKKPKITFYNTTKGEVDSSLDSNQLRSNYDGRRTKRRSLAILDRFV